MAVHIPCLYCVFLAQKEMRSILKDLFHDNFFDSTIWSLPIISEIELKWR